MELRFVLFVKILIEVIMIVAIAKRAKTLFGRGWAMGVSYLFIAGLTISALDSAMIVFYSDSTITTWSTISQLMRGASIEAIWVLVASLSFLHFMRAENPKVERLVRSIYSKRGITFISVYSLIALFIMMIFRLGFFKLGFTAIVQNIEGSNASWNTLFIDLPARIWLFPLGLLLIRAASKQDIHKRWLVYGVVAVLTAFITISLWTLGARGTVVSVTAFFFFVFIALDFRRGSLILLAGVIVAALVFMIPTSNYRLVEDLGSQNIFDRVRGLQSSTQNTSTWESLRDGIDYAVYRDSPAEPGVFAEWVEKNSAYAGIKPLIGSSLGLVPRSIWPDKPSVGSSSSTYLDKPEFITGRIMGQPRVTKGTSPGANSFWIAWYPGIVLFAMIAGWFAALVLRIGNIELSLGLLLLTITMAWGGTFLTMGIEQLLTMISQAMIPATVVLLVLGYSSTNKRAGLSGTPFP